MSILLLSGEGGVFASPATSVWVVPAATAATADQNTVATSEETVWVAPAAVATLAASQQATATVIIFTWATDAASAQLGAIAPGVLEMELAGVGAGWTVVLDWRRDPGIQWHRGYPGSRILDLVADVGTLDFTLDNSERNSAGLVGYYSPDHVNLRPGFRLNIGVRYRIGSYTRFTGTLDVITPIPGKHGPRSVQCQAVDWMELAQREAISNLPVLVNNRADEVFAALVASLEPESQPVAIEQDMSTETFPYTLDRTRDEQTILRDELYRVATSALDRIFIRGDGTLVYESRARRALITDDVDTFTDSHGFIAERGRASVVNRVQTTIHPRLPSAVPVVMYSLNQPLPINPGSPDPTHVPGDFLVSGGSVVIIGPWTDPDNRATRVGAESLEPVVAVTDYAANSQPDGSGTDLTAQLTVETGLSGNATSFTLTLAGSTPGYVILLQQRGRPLYNYDPIVHKWEDRDSVRQFGLRQQTVDMPYQANAGFGLEVAQYLVFAHSDPRTQVSGLARHVPFANSVEINRSVGREVGDRIRLQDVVTGVNRSFFINAIDETERDGVLLTEWLLDPADSTAFWLLEVVGRSELGSTTRLGFGLIIGHTDVAHGDSHGDSHSDVAHVDTHTDDAHQDIAHSDADTHGDTAHSDVAHVDTHGDTTHADVAHQDTFGHGDAPHSDVAHVDTPANYIAHQDVAHSDVTTHDDVAHQDVDHDDVAHQDVSFQDQHSDTPHFDNSHVDSHSDISHIDNPHADAHGDFNDDSGEHSDHVDGHVDSHGDRAHTDQHNDVGHGDAHSDTHGDVSHKDVNHDDTSHQDVDHADESSHGDVAHQDVAHTDVDHADTPHSDAHGDSTTHFDVAHQDVAHSDAAHVDTHTDTPHLDFATHGDAQHADVAHGDVAHSDSPHTDVAHSDQHSDTQHGDINGWFFWLLIPLLSQFVSS